MNWASDGPSGPDEWRDRLDEQLEHRLRELGTRTPRCCIEACDERNPFALFGVHPDIVCYEHALERRGQGWTEEHHWLGRQNDAFATSIPGNDHRVLSALQSRWPRETLRNPRGSPALKAAAALRSWLDLLWLLIYRLLGWIPPFLEWVDAVLTDHFGECWWDELGWPGQ